jgi:hypothetical protein
MSVNKLLQRVVSPNSAALRGKDKDHASGKLSSSDFAANMHEYTSGITSDPLTQFAVIFSALIHDVDHWGVSNNELIKEGVSWRTKLGRFGLGFVDGYRRIQRFAAMHLPHQQ